ncbi:unnamed protein product [Onchocerca flexuosa]|uniref:Uncharacterized protein n=1 Tax=Onchocerca flexuosa TaxID=387005 RepID=A0A183HZ48_9BILA|nr:unnamed protein product [Onchocerca flexuosa]
MNENNESSSASSTCDGDHASGNSPAGILSNNAIAVPSDPRRPTGPTADSDSNGESSFSNTVDASSDTIGSVSNYRTAGGGGGNSINISCSSFAKGQLSRSPVHYFFILFSILLPYYVPFPPIFQNDIYRCPRYAVIYIPGYWKIFSKKYTRGDVYIERRYHHAINE